MGDTYELILSPAAHRVLLAMPDQARKEIGYALRTELSDGPNADKEVWFDVGLRPCPQSSAIRVYKGTPLSFGAFVAISRALAEDELANLGKQERRRVARRGFLVHDILHPGLSFNRGFSPL